MAASWGGGGIAPGWLEACSCLAAMAVLAPGPDRWRVLVSSPDAGVADDLAAALPPAEFAVARCRPGFSFMRARALLPHIALIDRIHERSEAAQMEITVLKEQRGDVRIILLSEEPSPADADLIEDGVFYYLAAPSPATVAAVVRAAAASLRREAIGSPAGP